MLGFNSGRCGGMQQGSHVDDRLLRCQQHPLVQGVPCTPYRILTIPSFHGTCPRSSCLPDAHWPPVQDVITLDVGDTLYMPKGTVHFAKVDSPTMGSVHITTSIGKSAAFGAACSQQFCNRARQMCGHTLHTVRRRAPAADRLELNSR